jgi:ribosomal protein S18 acetylase RimI-like enzyme
MGIFPEYRGKGYGKALFRSLFANVIRNYPGVRYGSLLVNENWTHARKIYGKSGFYESDVIPDFFTQDNGSKSNGIVMRHDDINELLKRL